MASDYQTRIVLLGQLHPSLRNAFRLANSDIARAQQRLSKFGSVAGSVFKKAGAVAAVGLGAATASIAYVAKDAVGLASDLKEVQNVVDTSFGKSADSINKWSQSALNNFGLSELQAKQYSGTMGAMLKSTGLAGSSIVNMSTNLSGLAGDMASFYNLDTTEAFDKIRAGISGETEPLKQLGINMSVANLEAYALSQGIKVSYNNMDQASQTALRYSYLMKATKDAQGDFSKTSSGFANQQRLLKSNFQQLSAKIATAVLPTLEKLLQSGNKWLQSISNNPEKIKQIQLAITDWINKAVAFGQQATPKIIEFGESINKMIPYAMDLANTILNNWPTIISITKTMVEAYTVSKILSFIDVIKDLTKWYSLLSIAKAKDKFETLYLQGLYVKDALAKGATTLATWGMVAATAAWSAVTTIATAVGTAFGAVMAFITSPIFLVILAIAAVIAIVILLYKNWDKISKFMVGIWTTYVMPFFATIGTWFSGIWTGVVGVFKTAWNGVVGFITGIFSGIVGVIKGYLNIYIGLVNLMISGLNKISFTVPKGFPGGGKTIGFNIKPLPMFAKGGFANQASIFGEAGPEAAIPLIRNNPRSISLLNKTADILGVNRPGSGGGIIFNFYFSPTIQGVAGKYSNEIKELYEEFESRIREILRQEGRVSFSG